MSAKTIYRTLLCCYPAAFRNEYGKQMLLMFSEQLDEARRAGNRIQQASLWLRAALDAFTVAPKEHFHVIGQDVRYALRTLASSPHFATVAILSLALGIGANTALFSLWNGVLHSSLQVDKPEQLVMLTDPGARGVAIGMSTGERTLLSYAEFEQLRDQATVFSGLMASQSDLDRWQARVDGGAREEVQGRLVSGGYFQLLGVTPLLGRAFTAEDDRGSAPFAVLSYGYWQSRFGGRADVLGKSLTVRKAVLTIIGVMPSGFIGETSGQDPDLWIPLRQQPGVLPGRDWLHDTTPDKVMWLHVFGRLKPGVSAPQAQPQANAVFKAGLEAHYGTVVSEANRNEFLEQSLRITPAPSGASAVRNQFSDPLTILLIAVGVVMLIACANLANLLLARGAARKPEIALRLSLGASRG